MITASPVAWASEGSRFQVPCSIIASSRPASGASTRTRRSAGRAAMPSPTPVIDGEERVGEAEQQDPDDEDGDDLLAPVAGPYSVGAGGVAVAAQVEDVLHHGEADRGEPAVDEAVGDAGPLPAAEISSRIGPSALVSSSMNGRDQHRGQRVRQPPSSNRAAQNVVDRQRGGRGDERAPGEAEDQVLQRLRLVPVEPEEAAETSTGTGRIAATTPISSASTPEVRRRAVRP